MPLKPLKNFVVKERFVYMGFPHGMGSECPMSLKTIPISLWKTAFKLHVLLVTLLASFLSLPCFSCGEGHHFRVVQVPFNLQMREAAESHIQEVNDKLVSLLGAAAHFRLDVIACGTLQQQKLTSYCGDIIRDQRLPVQVLHCIADLGDQATDAQCALQFARTTPGIVTAIAGMRNYFHVEENAQIVKRLSCVQYHPELNTEPFQWRLGD